MRTCSPQLLYNILYSFGANHSDISATIITKHQNLFRVEQLELLVHACLKRNILQIFYKWTYQYQNSKRKRKKFSLMNPLIGPLFNILKNLFMHIHTSPSLGWWTFTFLTTFPLYYDSWTWTVTNLLLCEKSWKSTYFFTIFYYNCDAIKCDWWRKKITAYGISR